MTSARGLVLAAGSGALVVGWSGGALAAAVPDPCTILPGAVVSASAGLSGVSLHGVLSRRPDGGVRQSDVLTLAHQLHQALP